MQYIILSFLKYFINYFKYSIKALIINCEINVEEIKEL